MGFLLQQFRQQIAAQRGNGFAAQAELLFVEYRHSPEEEGKSHGEGLSAPDSTVADDSLPILGTAPPGEYFFLLGGKARDLSRLPTPPFLCRPWSVPDKATARRWCWCSPAG